jgi:hypothetical protein
MSECRERETVICLHFILQELGILMPDSSIEIHMIGVELSKKCDGRERTKDNVKITVHRCTYQKFFKETNKPDLAIGK